MVAGIEIKPEAFYDSTAVMRLLGVSVQILRDARKEGELRFTRKGNRYLYRGEWLLEWLAPSEATVA